MSILSSLKSLGLIKNTSSKSIIYKNSQNGDNVSSNIISEYTYPNRIIPKRRPYDSDSDWKYINEYYSSGSNYYL